MKQFVTTAQQYYINNEEISKCSTHKRQISSISLSSEKTLSTPNLNIILTNRGFQIYGTWSKTKIIKLLTNRLKKCIHAKLNSQKKVFYNTTNNERLWLAIVSGLYSTSVLKKLQNNGMSMYSILKAMKLGLISLNYCELSYFKDFNVDQYLLEFEEMWPKKFNDELILNLKPIGLTELECWNIIVYGVMFQNSRILCRLVLSGIDIPGILNWQSAINFASLEVIQFLKYIGVQEDIIQQAKQYGIDEETEQMLIDLGFNEMKEQFLSMEEVVCEYELPMSELSDYSLKKLQEPCEMNNLKSTSSSMDTLNHFQKNSCQCHILAKNATVTELTAQRNDYLRQNVMIPLTWALAETLKYRPTDPVHYTAYQLLRWTHNNVSEIKKNTLEQSIALATINMDHKLIEKKRLEEPIRKLNKEIIKNTVCKNSRKLQCIQRKYQECMKSLKKHEICKFHETYDSWETNISNYSG